MQRLIIALGLVMLVGCTTIPTTYPYTPIPEMQTTPITMESVHFSDTGLCFKSQDDVTNYLINLNRIRGLLMEQAIIIDTYKRIDKERQNVN